jgi:hypothetical protein
MMYKSAAASSFSVNGLCQNYPAHSTMVNSGNDYSSKQRIMSPLSDTQQ